ncbi:MAG: class I SAM-dependent methyltransferase [Candidatus Muirbacterium halophilum]|nr:class I SAM-dependent methyltransferase [Candidatus Muirbacterium halophilum]
MLKRFLKDFIIKKKLKVFDKKKNNILLKSELDEKEIFNYLKNLDLVANKELYNYLESDFKRFIYTVNLIPEKVKDILEIGSNPYFISVILEKYFDFDIKYTNFFGITDNIECSQSVKNIDENEKFEFVYKNINIEKDELDYKEKFDVILFCEVIEHLSNDPYKALINIKKNLRKDGYLILTTPNIARLENIIKIISGSNIYDPYSGYGAYGRHNREYSLKEIILFLEVFGFEIDIAFTQDVHNFESREIIGSDIDLINKILKNRSADLGQYIFIRAINKYDKIQKRPDWLFRSY